MSTEPSHSTAILILSIVGITLISPPLIHLIISHKHSNIKFHRIDIAASILSLICYLCSSLTYVIIGIYGIAYEHTPKFTATVCIAPWCAPLWMAFGYLFTAIFFISRLYKTFHGSAFAISRFAFKISIIALTSSFVISTALMGSQSVIAIYQIIAYPRKASIESYEECELFLDIVYPNRIRMLVVYLGIAIITLTDIITSVILLRLYLKKFILLSIACNEINSVIQFQTKRVKKENRLILRDNALFLSLAEKTTMIMILVTVCYFSAIIVSASGFGRHLLMLDNIIRSWCIYMTYKCGQKLYNIICFKDKLCFACCKRCCFCCCSVHKLPHELELIIHTKMSTAPVPAAAAQTAQLSVKQDSCSELVNVPRLKLQSGEADAYGVFLEDGSMELSVSQSKASQPSTPAKERDVEIRIDDKKENQIEND